MHPLFFLNPLTASDRELEDWAHIYSNGIKKSNLAITQSLALLMYEMAECGQISRIYKGNPTLTARHANMLRGVEGCFYKNYLYTGGFSTPTAHEVLLWANGALELYDKSLTSTSR
jgi:hypothetical protein